MLTKTNKHPHRTRAIQLLSMDLFDPLLTVMVSDSEYSKRLRDRLRSRKEIAVFGTESFNADKIVLGDIFSKISLAQFIDIWYWHQDRHLTALINEMSGVFFPVGSVANALEDFIQESLNIDSLTDTLSGLRNPKYDALILNAVQNCETSFLKVEPSDWDAELINTGIFPDPVFDISFPIYKGYLDFTAISTVRSLLRQHFEDKEQLSRWLTSLEEKIGSLKFKDRWEL